MTQPDQSPKRVLVVDDDTALAELICEVLNTAGGIMAEHVGDGEAALEAWRRGPYDLAIVDYIMPGMNAIDLVTSLRRLNRGPFPAIMISGNPVGDEALRAGMSAFIAKPFPMNRLLAEVDRALARESKAPSRTAAAWPSTRIDRPSSDQ